MPPTPRSHSGRCPKGSNTRLLQQGNELAGLRYTGLKTTWILQTSLISCFPCNSERELCYPLLPWLAALAGVGRGVKFLKLSASAQQW